MEDEASLLVRAARGDREAFERIAASHGAFARDLAAARLRRDGLGPLEAEEVVQEVWLALWQKGLAAVDPARGLRPYLAAAVLNTARNRLRAARRRESHEATRAHSRLPPCPEAPDEPLLRQERDGRIEAALETLTPDEQLALKWVYWQGLSYTAVARLLDIRPDSVGPLLSRARARLYRALRDSPGE